MKLEEIVPWMILNKYIKQKENTFTLTPKFVEDWKKACRNVPNIADMGTLPIKPVPLAELAEANRVLMYSFAQLIVDAKVPKFCENQKGEPYPVNKYSEEGSKAFEKGMKTGKIDYEILVKSVILYYSGRNKFKKNIGNYFIDGDWKSDYQALASAASTGEKELKQHIEEELKDGGADTGYRLG